MSDQNISPDDIPDSDINDPSRYVRLGRDYIGEQEEADAREDEKWTTYVLLIVLTAVLIAMIVSYLM